MLGILSRNEATVARHEKWQITHSLDKGLLQCTLKGKVPRKICRTFHFELTNFLNIHFIQIVVLIHFCMTQLYCRNMFSKCSIHRSHRHDDELLREYQPISSTKNPEMGSLDSAIRPFPNFQYPTHPPVFYLNSPPLPSKVRAKRVAEIRLNSWRSAFPRFSICRLIAGAFRGAKSQKARDL